jgi:predicted kinase
MTDPLIHLICGATGAGKSTYARELAERIGAVRFSIDEWMTKLFWMDTPKPLDPTWSMERVERCLAQIWAVASSVAERGVPCVLDVGFGQASSRARFAKLAGHLDLSVQLHFIDVPAEERWRRVQARTDRSGEGSNLPFAVTREMFNFVETMWGPPTDQELAACNGLKIANARDPRKESV